ncbi:hypothetical protein [Halomicrobium salinisoli]|uniref:hypothetical protein n=1 Tax=Halomicrobium salinisoli TaxID=2878391 RepID=UPI001CF0D42E|nr:hypothetical protein [Halomicrobium salinisoli]
MRHSRRRTIALLAGAALPATAGCTGDGAAGDGETVTADGATDGDATESSTDPALVVTVSGPDGERTFFDGTDVATVGEAGRARSGGYRLRVELDESGTTAASEAFGAVGGVDAPGETTVAIAVDGEETGSFEVRPDLARAIAAGEWRGEFVLTFANESNAEAARETIVGD